MKYSKYYRTPIRLNTRIRLILPLFLLVLFLIFIIEIDNNTGIFNFSNNWTKTIESEPEAPEQTITPINTKIYSLGSDFRLKNVKALPKIQYNFKDEIINEQRREAVKEGFLHAWNGYKKYAWGKDELLPVTNSSRDNFNGWAASMVESLDTMWLMGIKDEFKIARDYIDDKIDFSVCGSNINLFETVIRYLGSLLSAYEFSNDEMFLRKAIQLGDSLIPAFSSPHGLPYNGWNIERGLKDPDYKPRSTVFFLAQVGTLQLEFMKLAQLSGNSTYFFKAQAVIDLLDKAVKRVPGLYPITITPDGAFYQSSMTFGGSGDSFYEYLLKDYILVGGSRDQYKRMYEESINSMHKYLIKKSQVKDKNDLLFIGELNAFDGFSNRMSHLSCFVPGMLAIGSKILNRPNDLRVAKGLIESCYWVYNTSLSGISPDEFMFPYESNDDRLSSVDGRYFLRPEAIESLFVMYRVTGDKKYQDMGWDIWMTINEKCRTDSAYSGLFNVNSKKPTKNDNMESFFLAETLKYLYLLFSPSDLISLDDYVFNTEAHPFRIIKP